MISFSTSWANCDISRVIGVLPYIDFIEVGSRGNAGSFGRIEELSLNNTLTVLSVHASAGPHKRLHDPSYTPYFAFCDSERKEKDIDDVRRTAEWGKRTARKSSFFI
jgi:hypothetical protein